MVAMDLPYVVACAALLLFSYFAKHRNGTLFISAISVWITSAIFSQFLISNWSSVGYLMFYPLMFGAIPQLFEISQKTQMVHLIDGSVITLGSSTVISAIALRHLPTDFMHIFYPICDLILLIAVMISVSRRPINLRSLLIAAGFIIFASTDFFFLWLVTNNKYQINSLMNYGWIFGLLLIAVGQYFRGIKSEEFLPFSTFYFGVSVLASASMLAAIALHKFQIPNFIIAPALATLLASFIRMAIALKVSEKLVSEESLAKVDDLTGLPNRRRFISELERYLNGSILLMDLDSFKPVNDQYGHETGDELLRMVSNRFRKAIPDDALLARLGGDEFAVLIHEDYESALELAMALRATCSYPFTVAGNQIQIDVSIGCVSNDGRTDLMSRADTAMYQAKRTGVGVWAQET